MKQHCTNRVKGCAITSRPTKSRGAACLLGLWFALSHCAFGASLPDIEYEVLSIALAHGRGPGAGQIVIDDNTRDASVSLSNPTVNEAELLADLATSEKAYAEWRRVNRQSYPLSIDRLSATDDAVALSRDERQRLFNQAEAAANWRQFKQTFPDAVGIVRLSRPGIDDNAGFAVLYLEFECGHECGSGRLIGLTRTPNDQWQVSSGALLWITATP